MLTHAIEALASTISLLRTTKPQAFCSRSIVVIHTLSMLYLLVAQGRPRSPNCCLEAPYKIARDSQISQPTISRNVQFLRHQANGEPREHMDGKSQEEHSKCSREVKEVPKMAWTSTDS